MEIPEFCKQAAPRQLRKRKTEQEADPDFTPGGTPKPPNEERKKIRRSKKLEESRNRPSVGLNFIERQQYTIEDWKKKAAESRKTRSRISRTAKALASGMRDVNQSDSASLDQLSDTLGGFASADAYQRYQDVVEANSSGDEEDDGSFEFENLPKFVMGTGRGTQGGPPQFDFRSMWNFELDSMAAELEVDDPRETLFPWEKDVTEPNVYPQLISVVGSFTVGCELDLKIVAEHSKNVEFSPDKYAPLIMRIRDPKSTGLIFRTGRVIVNGTRSEEECKKAARKYARVIQKSGYDQVKVLKFEIQNMMASCDLKFRVRLNQMSRNKLYGRLSYEPEIFPGLLIPMEHPKVKIVIFCTGSILMIGAKSAADVRMAFRKAYPLIRMYAY